MYTVRIRFEQECAFVVAIQVSSMVPEMLDALLCR